MSLARLNDHAMGLVKENVTELERFIESARFREDPWVGSNANHTAQHLQGYTIVYVIINRTFEPGPTRLVVGGIKPEGMHKDADIRKNHGLFMTSSRSLDRLRSTP